MQQLFPFGFTALFILAGVLVVIFRRSLASSIIEARASNVTEVGFKAMEWFLGAIGFVFIVVGFGMIFELVP
jgi:hypothetical protein